mmetsp:Transcript_71948/g.197018  ORF Transcript_71948/g.197018 Transcript_71948/m.197018 type:complete len:314 (-) Transcript_71948:729-1670(-)
MADDDDCPALVYGLVGLVVVLCVLAWQGRHLTWLFARHSHSGKPARTTIRTELASRRTPWHDSFRPRNATSADPRVTLVSYDGGLAQYKPTLELFRSSWREAGFWDALLWTESDLLGDPWVKQHWADLQRLERSRQSPYMCKNGAAIYPTRQLCCVFKIFAILRALGAAAHRTVVISTLSCRPSRGSIDESVCAVSGVLTSARRAARLRRCDELQRDACAVDGLEPVSPRADPRERARCAAPAADTTAERRASRCRRMGAALAPAQSHDARAGAAHRQRVWHRALLSGQRIDVPAVQGQRVLLLQVAGGGDDV